MTYIFSLLLLLLGLFKFCYFWWQVLTIQILKPVPVLLSSVLLEISVIVDPIRLFIFFVEYFFKVSRMIFILIEFSISSHRSLLFFKSILLCSCQFHIPIFQCSLIWTSPCVSWCYLILHPVREVIKLENEVAEAVHEFPLFRIGSLSPYQFFFSQVLLSRSTYFLDE